MRNIMKKFLLPLIITFGGLLYSYGQKVSIKKTWIGNNQEYLKINDSIALFDNGHFLSEYHYEIQNNNFTFIEYYTTNRDKLRHENDFKYEILKLTTDTLILKFSEKSKQLRGGKDSFLLVDSSKLDFSNFKFERIIFSSTTGMGPGHEMKIEIMSTGKVFFLGKQNTGEYKGLYEGQLKPKELEKLNFILKHSRIDNFPTELGSALDMPHYSFIFYYNGKKKECGGAFVPYFNRELLLFLLDSYKKANLIKYV